MIKIFNTRLLALVCFIMSIGLVSSCKKDNNNTTSGNVQLLSFGPTGAKIGDTLSFIGYNLNVVTEIDFTGNGAVVPQSAFIQQTAELIKLIVPKATEQGFVTLKTPQGDMVTKTKLNLNVASMVSTITKQARPGENITITGDYLNWVTRVSFAKDKNVDTFVSRTINQIVVKVPLDAQTGPLVLSYSGTKPLQVETKDTLQVTLPVITSLAPNPVKHTTNLTITGTNLDLTKSVMFNGVATPLTTFVSQSATQLVVAVPASTTKGKISLVAASGVVTTASSDLDVVLPVIAAMSPNPIDTGTNLTITGSNLDLVTKIAFTGVLNPVTTFVSKSATQLVVTVPTGTLKGKVTLSVLNSTLTIVSADDLKINGGLPALADFPFAIYTDALQNTFRDYSYTDTHDFNSTANVRQGTKSIKAVYRDPALSGGGYQGVTLNAATGASTAAYTVLELSVFGEAGTGGKKINLVINGNYSNTPQITIVEGQWTTFSLKFTDIKMPATLTELVLQSAGFGGTVHIDHIGFR